MGTGAIKNALGVGYERENIIAGSCHKPSRVFRGVSTPVVEAFQPCLTQQSQYIHDS